jgi:hypothetical protein
VRRALGGIIAAPLPPELLFQLLSLRSALTEGPGDLLLQRFEQVLQRTALVGLDEDLDRHAGKQMNIPQAGLRHRLSSRSTMSLSLTSLPSLTQICPTTPPVGDVAPS